MAVPLLRRRPSARGPALHVATRAAPDPRLAAAALAGALLIGGLVGVVGLPVLALLGLVYLVFCVLYPAVGVAGLVTACALDRLAVPVAGSNLRPDELAALALAAALTLRVLLPSDRLVRLRAINTSAGRRTRIRGSALLVAILLYWGAGVLSTATAQGDNVARGASLDLLSLDLVALFVALTAWLTTPRRLLWAAKLWLSVATAEAVIGMAAFAWYLVAHGAVPGVQLAPDPPYQPLVYGTLYEGNIFGSYMSASFLLALALATEEGVRRKAPLYLVCAATAVGLLISDTRSAWGATVLGAVILALLLQFGRGSKRARLALRLIGGVALVVVVLGIGVAVLPASVTGALGDRVQGLLNFTSGSGYGRVQLYQQALGEWAAHPLLGLGPGSFTYRLPGDTSTGPAWLPNLTLQALHDTGLIGVAALFGLFAVFYVASLRALRLAPPGPERTVLAGVIAAVTALLISFQLTPGFSLGYSWALLAFGSAATAVARSLAVPGNNASRRPSGARSLPLAAPPLATLGRDVRRAPLSDRGAGRR